MSCFLCSDDHINAILAWRLFRNLGTGSTKWKIMADLGQAMREENEKSFYRRYPPRVTGGQFRPVEDNSNEPIPFRYRTYPVPTALEV